MCKDEFVEWLERQDIPVEEAADIEDYIDYLVEELGMSLPAGYTDVSEVQREAIEAVWRERYDIMPRLGVTPFELKGKIMGVTFVDTRYGIKGYPGAWGRGKMLGIAYGIAEELGDYEAMRIIEEWTR